MKYAFLACMAVSLLVPASSYAQPRPPTGGGGYQQTTQVINDCVRESNNFKKNLRRALNNSALNNSPREAQLNTDANNLGSTMDKVGDSWNRDHNMQATRVFVNRAIAIAQDINRTMVKWHLDPGTGQQWVLVRNQLNRLAHTFQLPKIPW
jgi:hypothetical protein